LDKASFRKVFMMNLQRHGDSKINLKEEQVWIKVKVSEKSLSMVEEMVGL